MKEHFAADEWSLLVQLPRWVVRAASAAQPDTTARTHIEINQGFLAVTDGVKLDSPLVASIIEEAKRVFDDPTPDEIDFAAGEPALAEVVSRAQNALSLVAAKTPAEADAWRTWVLAISDTVVAAARTGGVAGLGGVLVTPSEVSFDRRLEDALR